MDTIKQHIEALGKWAEQDLENRSVIIIAAKKMGDDKSVRQATALVGMGEMFVKSIASAMVDEKTDLMTFMQEAVNYIAAKAHARAIVNYNGETEDAESETESKEEE